MPKARHTFSISEPFVVGEWRVDPLLDRISQGETTVKLEPRTMRLLLILAQRPGDVVTADEMLATVWKDVIVSPSSVYEGVAQLRKALGDQSDQPRYIETVPRKGYRLVAQVSPRPERRVQPREELLVQYAAVADVMPVPAALEGVRRRRLPVRWQVWGPASLGLLVGLGIIGERLLQPASVISLPATSVAEVEPSAQRAQARILWVDDKPDNNIREREAMAAFKVQFDLALSTDDALRHLQAASYDLIISDMGRGTEPQAGYDLLNRLRQRGDTTRVIFYTGSCTDMQMQEARTRGALGCATRISELLSMALSTLEARR
jgi:DNA-binding winged helix-turn-helix (wHTH) protein/CheY-like chemotaxis protein